MYNVDLNRVVRQFLPVRKKQPVMLAFVYSLIYPITELYERFLVFRETIIFKARYNSQIMYIEHLLNSYFNEGGTSIYIQDGVIIDEFYLFKNSEPNDAEYIYKVSEGGTDRYLYLDSEYGSIVDFIVNVPSAITYDTNLMKAWINRYKMAGKKYSIVNY